jgi:hypothetical protein
VKYIKSYQLWESQSDDIKLDISDILLELEELDIKSSVVDYTYRGIKCIRTRIFKYISWNHLGEPDSNALNKIGFNKIKVFRGLVTLYSVLKLS